MSTRWDREDFWAEFEYARPPARRRALAWERLAWLVGFPLVCWLLVGFLIWRVLW